LFEVINNFRLYDRVCIVSALKVIRFHATFNFSDSDSYTKH
jgi:hypothetical protein